MNWTSTQTGAKCKAFLRGPAKRPLIAEVVRDCPGATEADALAVYEEVMRAVNHANGDLHTAVFAMSMVYPVLYRATIDQVCRRVVRERKAYVRNTGRMLQRFRAAFPWVEERYALRVKLDDDALLGSCLFCTDVEQFVDTVLLDEWRKRAYVEMVQCRTQ